MRTRTYTTISMEIEKKKNKINSYVKIFDFIKLDKYINKELALNSLSTSSKLVIDISKYRNNKGIPENYIDRQEELNYVYSKYIYIPQYWCTIQDACSIINKEKSLGGKYLSDEESKMMSDYIYKYNQNPELLK